MEVLDKFEADLAEVGYDINKFYQTKCATDCQGVMYEYPCEAMPVYARTMMAGYNGAYGLLLDCACVGDKKVFKPFRVWWYLFRKYLRRR